MFSRLLLLGLLASTTALAQSDTVLRDAGSLGGIRLAGSGDENASKV